MGHILYIHTNRLMQKSQSVWAPFQHIIKSSGIRLSFVYKGFIEIVCPALFYIIQQRTPRLGGAENGKTAHPNVPLRDIKIRNLKSGDKAYKISNFEGLFILVKASGAKSWRFKYRIDGKERCWLLVTTLQ